jgi:hypothetical protein
MTSSSNLMTISDRAITIARTYVGQTESSNNDATWLRQLMLAGGNPASWVKGEAYCIAAALACFGAAFKEDGTGKTFPFSPSAGSQQAYENALEKQFTSDLPSVGDIVIFRHGNTWQGHAGIVTSIVNNDGGHPIGIATIEFNTSSNMSGNQRNGEGCFAKVRNFHDYSPGVLVPGRLWIRGYIKMSTL